MYESEQMTDDDPVRRKLSRSTKPFLWSEAQYDPWREQRAKQVMERASDFRMNQGHLRADLPSRRLGGGHQYLG